MSDEDLKELKAHAVICYGIDERMNAKTVLRLCDENLKLLAENATLRAALVGAALCICTTGVTDGVMCDAKSAQAFAEHGLGPNADTLQPYSERIALRRCASCRARAALDATKETP